MQPVQSGRASDTLIQQVIVMQHPGWLLIETVAKSFPNTLTPEVQETLDSIEAARAALRAKPAQEVLELHRRLSAAAAAAREQAAAVKVAKRRAEDEKAGSSQVLQPP